MENVLFELPEISEYLSDGVLPSPSQLLYYRNLEERVIWIEGEIDDQLTDCSKLIMYWNRQDTGKPFDERKPIKLFINSVGGLLDTTMSLIGLIGLSKTPIYTINAGIAYSAACLILISGHKRFAMPHTKCLIHSGSGGLGGTYEQTMEQAKEYKNTVSKMKNYILEHTDIGVKLYNRKSSSDWYIDNEECLKYGIVHQIVDDIDMVL